jgi:hypothetical protein
MFLPIDGQLIQYLLKRWQFLWWIAFATCHRSIDCIYVGLFVNSQLCSSDLFIYGISLYLFRFFYHSFSFHCIDFVCILLDLLLIINFHELTAYFIFCTSVNSIVFLISNVNCSMLIYKKGIDFCILILFYVLQH